MTSPHDRRLDRLAVIYRRGDPPGVDLARFTDAEIEELAALAIRRLHGGPDRDWTAAERATLDRIEDAAAAREPGETDPTRTTDRSDPR